MAESTALAPIRDPFTLMRQMTSELDRMFDTLAWPSFRWPVFRTRPTEEGATWFPEIDVFEKGDRLITKIDLPGMKKEDVKVEVTPPRRDPLTGRAGPSRILASG
jgi:HSP20 family protein